MAVAQAQTNPSAHRWRTVRALLTSRTGVLMLAGVVLLALFGPFAAPYSPNAISGPPFGAPTGDHFLGLDYIGRDVLSRTLWGGRSALLVATAATAIAYVVGIIAGTAAVARPRPWEPVLMRSMDLIMAFPPIIVVLLLVSATRPSMLVLIGAIALTLVPSITRLVRAAASEVYVQPYIEAAVARGERSWSIVSREVLPNIQGTLLADVGIRFTGAVLLAAALNFVGLGLRPPSADWALMVGENAVGLTVNPYAVAIPAALIACLTVASNLVADGAARSLGHFGSGTDRRG